MAARGQAHRRWALDIDVFSLPAEPVAPMQLHRHADAGAELLDAKPSNISAAASMTARPLFSRVPAGQKVSERTSSLTMDKEFHPFRLDTTNQCLWRRGDSGEEERI